MGGEKVKVSQFDIEAVIVRESGPLTAFGMHIKVHILRAQRLTMHISLH